LQQAATKRYEPECTVFASQLLKCSEMLLIGCEKLPDKQQSESILASQQQEFLYKEPFVTSDKKLFILQIGLKASL
jgi:hypothetical protein